MDSGPNLRSILDARALVVSCVQDALERGHSTMRCEQHTSVEGSFAVVRDERGTVLAVIDAILPAESPFDDVPRDRLRNVAARLEAPFFLLTNFRRVVTYRTAAVTERRHDEDQIVGWQYGGDVQTLDDVRVAATSVNVTTALKHALAWLSIEVSLDPAYHVRDAAAFFAERITSLFDDMVACTDGSIGQRDAALRLGTSILAYVLVQLRSSDMLDRLAIPYGTRSADLMLDLVGAFFRQARRRGFAMLPARVDDVQVLTRREPLFRMTLADLVHFLHRFDPERLSDTDLHRAVDNVLQRCARAQRTSVPTIDAIDLALRAARYVRPAQPQHLNMLEIGSTQGLASVRQILMSGLHGCDARVYAPTPDDERAVVLRSSGRFDSASDVRVLRDTKHSAAPWDLVVATTTDIHERHRLRVLLERMPIADHGIVVLFLPLSALHNDEYVGMRQVLTSRFEIEWVIVSDAEALAEPDSGVCCVLARRADPAPSSTALARFVYLRRPIAAFFPTSRASRDLEQARLKTLDQFVAYLDASERGKLNDEAVVRMVDQATLRRRSSWEDELVPPDILASILTKTGSLMHPLRTYAEVTGGIRTGANDVFAPTSHEIATDDLEMQYWQRTVDNGNVRDNLLLTSHDDIDTMCGLPHTDRRLLLLPRDRSALTGTNVLTRMERAERDGIHLRASVRHRDVWWHLPEPAVPHIVIHKHQSDRWVVGRNTAQAFITDAFIGVTMHDESLADAVAVWMNSTLGLFLSQLGRFEDHVLDITVRDAQEFPIPGVDILSGLDLKRHSALIRRPIHTLTSELGAPSADTVRQETVARDRRKLDAWLMTDVFGLTDEEQRWVYRFALTWWSRPSNVRHLTNSITSVLERTFKLKPLRFWYQPQIDQLPAENRRTLTVSSDITSADIDGTMFGWRVTCSRGGRRDEAIECASSDEAELIAHLINLGRVRIEVPTDLPIVAEILPRVRTFRRQLDHALEETTLHIPDDLRPLLRQHIMRSVAG